MGCRAVLIFLSIFCFISVGAAQGEWQLYHQSDNLTIEVRDLTCNDVANGITKQYKQLRFSNTSADKVLAVSFYRNLWYDDNCTSCNHAYPEYFHEYTLPAGATLMEDCEKPIDKGLMLFIDMPNIEGNRKLTNFELAELTVEEEEL